MHQTGGLSQNRNNLAAKHDKWEERPVLLAMRVQGASLDEARLFAVYEGKIARWQAPDKVIFVDVLPLGGMGKVLKNKLREGLGSV